MSRGPGIREIFSHKAVRKNNAFHFDNQEQKEQLKISNKNDNDVHSPMKKFGGYKPKILAGEVDFIEIQNGNSADSSTQNQSEKRPPQNNDTLTTKLQPISSKPWIIGDKNIPIVLESTHDNDGDDSSSEAQSQIADSNTYNSIILRHDNNTDVIDSQRTLSVSSETYTLIRQNSDDSKRGLENPIFYENSFVHSDDIRSLSTAQDAETDRYSFIHNGVFSDAQTENELEGVFIPAPDYEEDEKTLDFYSEDADEPSDGGDDSKPRQMKHKSAVKVYEGADLSHFLIEDDFHQEMIMRNEQKPRNTVDRNGKPVVRKSKESQKQFLYKQQSPTKGKRKSSVNAPTFSSVRSFSYADSKYGTKGQMMGKSFSTSNLTDDDEIFLNASTQQSSYESFLKSRHADDLPSEYINGENKNGELEQNSRKDDPVWKKLTLRLKKRLSKSINTKE